MSLQISQSRRSAERAAGKAEIDGLPASMTRERVIGISAAAEFISVSVNTCRRMYGNGTLPRPVPLNSRKLGYQVGTLIDWLEARKKSVANRA